MNIVIVGCLSKIHLSCSFSYVNLNFVLVSTFSYWKSCTKRTINISSHCQTVLDYITDKCISLTSDWLKVTCDHKNFPSFWEVPPRILYLEELSEMTISFIFLVVRRFGCETYVPHPHPHPLLSVWE